VGAHDSQPKRIFEISCVTETGMRAWNWQRGVAQLTGSAWSRGRLISLADAVAFVLVYALLLPVKTARG
jgi:hypothetical protein